MTLNELDRACMANAEKALEYAQCHSRKIGAAIYFGERFIASGCNGAVATPPCVNCLRVDVESGQNLHICQAIHAEVNAIAMAARRGRSTNGATMYLTCGVPCKDCFNAITVAGITRIVCRDHTEFYDDISREMVFHSKIRIDTYPITFTELREI